MCSNQTYIAQHYKVGQPLVSPTWSVLSPVPTYCMYAEFSPKLCEDVGVGVIWESY